MARVGERDAGALLGPPDDDLLEPEVAGGGPGEDIAPPLSIGEYLFSEIGERGERGVLVFLPQVPSSEGLIPFATEPLDG